MLAATILVAASQPVQAAPVADRQIGALSQHLFPMLSSLGRSAGLPERLRGQPEMAGLLTERARRAMACASDLSCITQAGLWSDAELVTLGNAIVQDAGDLLRREKMVPDDGIAAGVAREIKGVNAIVQIYALGAPARYPAIDGPPILPDSAEAKTRLQAAMALRDTPRKDSIQALDPSIELALALLDVNDRTDAIGFEPIDAGPNETAMARARHINWKRYRYTAIILPGIGPEVLDMPLSPGGKYHVRLAASRFADGVAPFIIVSGGRAHPRGAVFAEAVEMRRALIERYGVPANAIIIEPYARHTTTNLRNATRRLMAMGAPMDRDALIVSNSIASQYIAGPIFAERNLRELGYQPGAIGQRISATDLSFRPAPVSARVDPLDPLDP
ncbi:hypothetical protein BH10PSE12_BH10PSE12_04470 [soil metagenome]